MKDFILLMHGDTSAGMSADLWPGYLSKLQASGAFAGGSAIGGGEILRKDGIIKGITQHLTGYIRIRAQDLDDAKALTAGNPVFECGGSVEIRELPRD